MLEPGVEPVSVSRRIDLKRIVKLRDKKIVCPACGKNMMRFKPVRGAMKKWSPSPYAWTCPTCHATKIDGSIIPEDDRWDKRMLDDERSRLSSFLSKALNAQKK